jgi:hypothetical protein
MPTIRLDGSEYLGRTSSPLWRGPQDSLECRRCGSSLTGRREAVQKVTTRGVCLVREVFRCKCGRGRWIERQEVSTG